MRWVNIVSGKLWHLRTWLLNNEVMAKSKNCLFFLLFATCLGCVSPLQQQNLEGGNTIPDGFVGPLIIDAEEFNRMAASLVYDRSSVDDKLLPVNNTDIYDGTFVGKPVYIRNCKCMKGV